MKRFQVLSLAISLVLLSAAPSLADYSLPVSTTAGGGGKASNQAYHLSFVVGQPSPLVTASDPVYNLTTGLVTLLLDVRPPAIVHSPPGAAVPDRTALDVVADIADDRTGVEEATVFYREGGLAAYRQKAMNRDGSSFSAAIPPSAVTEKGLLYYIEATDNAGNKSRYPQGAPDSLISVRVWFEDLESAIELPAGRYRMISLPGSTGGNPDQVLVDDLGSYDKKVWRLGRWNPSPECSADCYDEYPALTNMDRGKAFWLITAGASRFDFSGLSTLPESAFRIHLERGWNQIGTPFAFTTDWLSTQILFDGNVYVLNEEHVVGGDTIYVEDNIVSYDGTYHGHQSAMEPWHGYWLYNGSTQEVDLLINPEGPAAAVRASPVRQGVSDIIMELTVSSIDFPERNALAGFSPSARDGWDPMDHREPPAFGDYLRLVFEKPAWGNREGIYMSDIRQSSQAGAFWQFRVEASKSTSATLGLLMKGVMPETWRVYLYDEARGLRIGAVDLPHRFQLDRDRGFSLIAGTEEYIRLKENEVGISLNAQIVGIAPNPFRRSVEISCFAPQGGRLELDVFSVEGRRVRTIAGRAGESGIGRVIWAGDSDRHEAVAPGLYFLRMRTGRSTHTAKVLKIH
jgi:hypothetical protein